MQRLLAVLIPIAVCVAVSAWLYGWPGKSQRLSAAPRRRRVVLGAVLSMALIATIGFFIRGTWIPVVGEQGATSLFLGTVVLVVALLYAILPPQRDL